MGQEAMAKMKSLSTPGYTSFFLVSLVFPVPRLDFLPLEAFTHTFAALNKKKGGELGE